MTGAVLLRTEQMTKRFGGLVAVDRLDLEVEQGAIHSIIGPNGAGKTTVFNCIMEFYPPEVGQIWFAGQRIDGLTPDRVAAAGINRTYQTIRLFKNLTAIENILVGMHIHLKSTWYGAVFNTRATRGARRAPMTRRAAFSTLSGSGAAATWSQESSRMASSGAWR
jgi:branched-chain amino acid transport system ATP-binding protein